MSQVDRSYERLKAANPNPTVIVEDKPSAAAMLAAIEVDPREVPGAIPVRRPGAWTRPALVAASFAAAAALLVPILLIVTQRSEEPVGTTLPTTSIPSTTEPLPTSTSTTTTIAEAIDPGTQALIEQFIDVYNAGEVEAFMGFLAPDFRMEWTIDRTPWTQPLEDVRVAYEVDAALNTEIDLSCQVSFGAVVCEQLRYDDLNRILGNPPLAHWRIRPEFDDGLLVRWSETRYHNDTEYDAQVRPFMDWVREAHPEVGELFPFVAGGWVIRDGIAQEIVALVEEWAAVQGVGLDG